MSKRRCPAHSLPVWCTGTQCTGSIIFFHLHLGLDLNVARLSLGRTLTACWSGARTAWHGQVGDRDIGEGGGHQTGEITARPIPQSSVDIAGFKRSKSLPKWRLVAVSGLWATGQRRVWRHSSVRKSFFFSVDERL